MKRNRPSGSQQRKIKKAKEKSAEAMSGSILKYVAPSTSTAVGESAEDVQSVESRGEMPEVSSQEASYVKAQELEKIILSSSGESDVDESDACRSLHQQDSDDDDEEEEETVRLSVERLLRHLEAAKISVEEAKKWTALQFLEFLVKWDYCESLPNLSLCLRFFLTLCVSIASCEISFSKLKLIKNFFRSTMSETRLTNLAILSIEHEYARKIGFDEVIDKFAEMKARRQRM
ncbi:zinc finger MYM-type 1-like [Pelobates cultripes]|uniref:Zinc finger MYM-type 1-like n=1 Tax=Pelobates cultripes TaxID=61616 RepID=A0AAD1R3F6_PELCU|nr:zinc finger MYM-type 1-like [Pelobates cultripes]